MMRTLRHEVSVLVLSAVLCVSGAVFGLSNVQKSLSGTRIVATDDQRNPHAALDKHQPILDQSSSAASGIGSSGESTGVMDAIVEKLTKLIEQLIQKVESLEKRVAEKIAAISAKSIGTGTVRVETRLNFRDGPWGNIIGTFNDGDTFELLAREGDWYKIRSNGKIGYAYAAYVSTSSTPATTTAPAAKPSIPAAPATPAPTAGGLPRGTGAPMKCNATGYYPPPPGGYSSKAEAAMEGGAYDCRGKPLRTLQDYNPKDPTSYVSCATDPRVIKTGTYFTLDEFPGVRFLACDVGGGIKNNDIDICVKNKTESYKVTKAVTFRAIK